MEIDGNSKASSNTANSVSYHSDASKYTNHEKVCTITGLNSVEDFMSRVRKWSNGWLREHPTYNIHGDNCQKFVNCFFKDFCECSIDSGTQHQEIGAYVFMAGLAFMAVGHYMGTLQNDKPKKKQNGEEEDQLTLTS